MNCREAERLLDTFFDGELDGRLMRDAALHITRCQSCERELQEKEGVKNLLADTIEVDLSTADLSTVWAGVEAGIARHGQGVSVGSQDESATDEVSETPRRGFGRRAGGRHVDSARRGGRRGVGRISAAGVGAVAMGLAAFLVFNVGPEQEGEPLLAESLGDSVNDSAARVASGVAADTAEPAEKTVVAEAAPPKVETKATTAVASAPRKSGPQTVASLGPVTPSSEWQQVQVGPLDYSDHAAALWRPAAAR